MKLDERCYKVVTTSCAHLATATANQRFVQAEAVTMDLRYYDWTTALQQQGVSNSNAHTPQQL